MASDGEDDCPELLLKVIVCGDSGVGKTALLERMFSNRFDPRLPSTIGKNAIRFLEADAGITPHSKGKKRHLRSCACLHVGMPRMQVQTSVSNA